MLTDAGTGTRVGTGGGRRTGNDTDADDEIGGSLAGLSGLEI